MTNVTMKALDTLHISSVSQHSMAAGTEFDVSTPIADDLEARGLATRVVATKAEPAPANKSLGKAPANKGR